MMRRMRSEPPPGALVAMSSTGLSGFHSCAQAVPATASAIVAASAGSRSVCVFKDPS